MDTLELRAEGLAAQLDSVSDAIREKWWRPYCAIAEGVLAGEQARHFQEESGPNGEVWPPLSPLTLALSQGSAAKQNAGKSARKQRPPTRFLGSPPLQEKGALKNSVTTGGKYAVREITSDTLTFGTSAPYGPAQQFGAKITVTDKMRGFFYATTGVWVAAQILTLPARPFLGISPSCAAELTLLASETLQFVIDEAVK